MSKWKYIRKDPLPNGNFRYIYEDDVGTDGASSASLPERKTGSWVSKYLEALSPSTSGSKITASSLKGSKKAAKGKKKASKFVNTNKVYQARTTSTQLTKEDLQKKYDQVESQAKTEKENNEKYFNDLFEAEKAEYRKKLEQKYGSGSSAVDTEMEKYSSALWETVYKPLADRANKNIDNNSQSVMRALKRLIEEREKEEKGGV